MNLSESVDQQDTSTSAATTEETVTWNQHWFVASVRFISFWTAVGLPVLYVPLLATGLDSAGKAAVFAVLLGVNLVSLLLGHSYCPS